MWGRPVNVASIEPSTVWPFSVRLPLYAADLGAPCAAPGKASVPVARRLWPAAFTASSRSAICSRLPAMPPEAVTAPSPAGVAPASFSTRSMSGASKLKAMSGRGCGAL
jgi:hypothetical protein